MERVHQIANLYVATLRAIYLVEQSAHWHSKGDNFYGNHLLLERLYKALVDETDQAAEKMIGLFGKNGVDYKTQCSLIGKIVEKYADLAEKPIEQAMAIEKDFLKLSDTTFNELEKLGALSIGLDDMLMNIASKHETATYLLQQVLENK